MGQSDSRPVGFVRFDAPSVDREMAFNILLPEGYENGDQRYPVLYLLHGRRGDHNYWADLGVPEYAVDYRLIVVMPDAGPSWYVNWSKSDNGESNRWEDYLTRDLIEYVDANYRTVASRSGRAVCGMSMGGYGALTAAFRNPDLYCSTCSISGGLAFMDKLRAHLNDEGPDPLFLTGEVPESKKELAAATPRGRMVMTLEECDAIDPFELVQDVPVERLPEIRIDCGLSDSLLVYSQRFARLLMEHRIPFTFSQAPGAHTPEYASRAVKDVMVHQYSILKQ